MKFHLWDMTGRRLPDAEASAIQELFTNHLKLENAQHEVVWTMVGARKEAMTRGGKTLYAVSVNGVWHYAFTIVG